MFRRKFDVFEVDAKRHFASAFYLFQSSEHVAHDDALLIFGNDFDDFARHQNDEFYDLRFGIAQNLFAAAHDGFEHRMHTLDETVRFGFSVAVAAFVPFVKPLFICIRFDFLPLRLGIADNFLRRFLRFFYDLFRTFLCIGFNNIRFVGLPLYFGKGRLFRFPDDFIRRRLRFVEHPLFFRFPIFFVLFRFAPQIVDRRPFVFGRFFDFFFFGRLKVVDELQHDFALLRFDFIRAENGFCHLLPL